MCRDEQIPQEPEFDEEFDLSLPEDPQEDLMIIPDEDGEIPEEASPEEEEVQPLSPGKSPRRGSRTGTLIFYTLYILLTIVVAGSILLVNNGLKKWLTDYQLSQPTDKRDRVYAEFFAEPDWYKIYETVGIRDTRFEDADAFAAYMTGLVGDTPLELVETSAGLSGNRKYFLKLEGNSIASFLLTSHPDSVTGLTRWELGDMEVFFQRSEAVTIRIQKGQTAYVNGIPLDESYTIRMDYSLAPQYLPVGVYSHRTDTQYLSGLLVEPEITVLDEAGQSVTVIYDSETDLYRTEAPSYPTEIPADVRKTVVAAAKAYGDYLLGKTEGETDSLLPYFDRTTDVWRELLKNEPFDQETALYEYVEETVGNYRQYAEDLFSVRVRILIQSTPIPEEDPKKDNKDNKDNQDKTPEPEPEEHIWEATLFFRKDEKDWVCIGLTDAAEPEGASRVLLTFVMDGVTVSDNFHDTALRQMVVPLVSAPSGRRFSGWYREELQADGSCLLSCVFLPDESGLVVFPEDFTLQPMTLYALFEDAETETEVTE